MLNPNKNYSGLAVEFKSPLHGGITSEDQDDMFDKYKSLGYKVIHSNNYIIMAIYDYVKEIRIVCQYCPRKFRNKDMLANHQKWVHRDKRIK